MHLDLDHINLSWVSARLSYIYVFYVYIEEPSGWSGKNTSNTVHFLGPRVCWVFLFTVDRPGCHAVQSGSASRSKDKGRHINSGFFKVDSQINAPMLDLLLCDWCCYRLAGPVRHPKKNAYCVTQTTAWQTEACPILPDFFCTRGPESWEDMKREASCLPQHWLFIYRTSLISVQEVLTHTGNGSYPHDIKVAGAYPESWLTAVWKPRERSWLSSSLMYRATRGTHGNPPSTNLRMSFQLRSPILQNTLGHMQGISFTLPMVCLNTHILSQFRSVLSSLSVILPRNV